MWSTLNDSSILHTIVQFNMIALDNSFTNREQFTARTHRVVGSLPPAMSSHNSVTTRNRSLLYQRLGNRRMFFL